MPGLNLFAFKVQVMTGYVTDIGAQKLLGRYVDASGDYSIKAKVEADPTLGNKVDHARVISASDEQLYDLQGKLAVGREFMIEILATNSITINVQREAIAAILESIPATQVSAYALGSPTLPTIQVIGAATEYDETLGTGL